MTQRNRVRWPVRSGVVAALVVAVMATLAVVVRAGEVVERSSLLGR